MKPSATEPPKHSLFRSLPRKPRASGTAWFLLPPGIEWSGLGGRELDRTSGDSGYTCGQRARRHIQFQSAASRSQPWRFAHALEHNHQQAGHTHAGIIGYQFSLRELLWRLQVRCSLPEQPYLRNRLRKHDPYGDKYCPRSRSVGHGHFQPRPFWIFVPAAKADSALRQVLAHHHFLLKSPSADAR